MKIKLDVEHFYLFGAIFVILFLTLGSYFEYKEAVIRERGKILERAFEKGYKLDDIKDILNKMED